MKIIDINNENFEQEVLKAKLPVLVDFNAVWCPPCRMQEPILEEIADENENVVIASCDVDTFVEIAAKYDISGIPCLVLFKDGIEIDRKVGFTPKKKLLKMLELK